MSGFIDLGVGFALGWVVGNYGLGWVWQRLTGLWTWLLSKFRSDISKANSEPAPQAPAVKNEADK